MMKQHAGALNVAAATVRRTSGLLEQVLQWNPEVIFVQTLSQVVKQIENDPQWQAIDAVKTTGLADAGIHEPGATQCRKRWR